MNVRVDTGRFLSVTSDPEERIVYDRQEKKYHLLRESAARLWDQIGEGGVFDVEASGNGEPEGEPIQQLREAGLIQAADTAFSEGQASRISRRSWMRRTGQVAAAALVLPLVASISTPGLVLGQEPGGDACSLIDDESGEDSGSDIESGTESSGCGESGES